MGEIHHLIERHGYEEARRIATCETKHDALSLSAAHAVMSDDRMDMGVTHAGFAMASLPHRRIKEQVWQRDGGSVKLLIESGLDQHQNPIGIPYGADARMILLYLQTQAVRTKSREIELGASMNQWLERMGMTTGGRNYKSVREQCQRISRCRLTFFQLASDYQITRNGAFIRDAIMPIGDNVNQASLWREAVRLDEAFYESLIDHPLPIREAAIQQISGKSKAIDLYIWLAYRLHVLNKPIEISWEALRTQFAPEHKSNVWFFKRDIEGPLKLALAVYPEAHVDVEPNCLRLYPSPPPVAKRLIAVK